MEKIKVVYICHFSNEEIQKRMPLRLDFFSRLLLAKNHLPQNTEVQEFAVWNTNCIKELQKYPDKIELHVIAPYHYLRPRTFCFEDNGTHYYFYRSDDDYLPLDFLRRVFHVDCSYKRNRKVVKRFISSIKPDIVHCVGAENPYYSICSLDSPSNVPLLVQLQTLMSDPNFEKNYPISHTSYLYRSGIEKAVIKRADYIGFAGKNYIDIIKNSIKKDAVFVRTVLALAEDIDLSVGDKKYDFVYFSSDISKAADLAIEAFFLASQKHPEITLNIIGGFSANFKSQLDKIILQYNIQEKVIFSGKLPSHEDVLKQIRLARFALLPLKFDSISGTIREAMANGLPVITTITSGTPSLNTKRESVLLSKVGDHQSLANNMCLLLENGDLANKLRINGGKYMEERDNNMARVSKYVEIYDALIKHFHNGTPIPIELLS